mgnify:CR=1 FL=1
MVGESEFGRLGRGKGGDGAQLFVIWEPDYYHDTIPPTPEHRPHDTRTPLNRESQKQRTNRRRADAPSFGALAMIESKTHLAERLAAVVLLCTLSVTSMARADHEVAIG